MRITYRWHLVQRQRDWEWLVISRKIALEPVAQHPVSTSLAISLHVQSHVGAQPYRLRVDTIVRATRWYGLISYLGVGGVIDDSAWRKVSPSPASVHGAPARVDAVDAPFISTRIFAGDKQHLR